MSNPCRNCGACCAFYRVSFHIGETDEHPDGHVPAGLTEPVTGGTVCLRGTAAQPPRCIALRGTIGETVSCIIYEQRPSPCREFAPLATLGRGDEACNEARRRHGLPPLDIGP
jgi:uncharacterized protein